MTIIVCCKKKKLKELLTFSNLGNQKPLFFPMQFVYQDPLRPWEKVLVAVAWHNEPAKSPTYPSPKAIRWITLGTVGWTPRNALLPWSWVTSPVLPDVSTVGLPNAVPRRHDHGNWSPAEYGRWTSWVVTKGQSYFFHEAKTCRICKQTVLGLKKSSKSATRLYCWTKGPVIPDLLSNTIIGLHHFTATKICSNPKYQQTFTQDQFPFRI